MKHTWIRSALALALLGAAAGAQAQVVLPLQCPSGAAGAATPIEMYTGGDWQMRYGATGTLEPAYMGYKHNNWYPAGGAPASGSWITPGPLASSRPSVDPWFYLSPVIDVDARIDLTTIQVEIRHAVDNYYLATGVVNSNQPAGVMVPGNGGHNDFGLLGAGFIPALTGWIEGENRLLIETGNAEATHGPAPTGLYAVLNITADCVAATPNVGIDISALPTSGTEGQAYSGSFSCKNTGTGDAASAACDVTGLPSGVSVGACTISPNGDPWTSPDAIPAGETVTCQVSGTPATGTVGAHPLTGTGGTQTANATLTIVGVSNVGIDLGGLPATATVGQSYGGSFSCTNSGTAAAASAACELSGLPAGVTVGACTISPSNTAWTSPSAIPAGETVTCLVGGTPATSAIGTHTLNGTGGSQTASKTLTVAGVPAVTIDLSTLPTTGAEGQPYNGNFSCKNNGTATAASAACDVTGLPPGVSVGACTISPSGSPWTSPSAIPAGETVTCPVSGTPASGSTGAHTLTGTSGSATASTTLTIGAADVVIDLSGLPTSGALNQPYNGSFTCTNNGTAAATNVTCGVTGLPAGVTVQGCTISPNGDPWTSPGTIPAGQTVTCTVSGTPTQTGTSTVNAPGSSAARSIVIGLSANVEPVPTLGSLGLMLTGLLLAGLVTRRRKMQ